MAILPRMSKALRRNIVIARDRMEIKTAKAAGKVEAAFE
jgi:hypothetical protein